MGSTRFRVTRAARTARAAVAGEVVDVESTEAAAPTVATCVAEDVDGAECLLDLAETKNCHKILSRTARKGKKKKKKEAFHITKSFGCSHSKDESVHHVRRRWVDFFLAGLRLELRTNDGHGA